jgi:hypothetical protein
MFFGTDHEIACMTDADAHLLLRRSAPAFSGTQHASTSPLSVSRDQDDGRKSDSRGDGHLGILRVHLQGHIDVSQSVGVRSRLHVGSGAVARELQQRVTEQ